jgi:hypothetical protein
MNTERIINIVSDIYVDHEIGELGFDPVEMAKRMGHNVIPYSSLGETASQKLIAGLDEDGFSLYNPRSGRCEIYYNDSQYPPSRKFFMVPHETGHIELGHVFGGSEYDEEQEKEADFFARWYYMPEIILVRRKLLTETSLISTFHISWDYADVILGQIRLRRMHFAGGEIKFRDCEERLYESFCLNEKKRKEENG